MLAGGKMHASGIIGEGGENIITKEDIRQFAEAGADIILLPAPGTVPGITDQLCTQPEKADDHIDRNFSGRCGHRYDQTHRTGVQDGRNRHPPHR